MDIVQQAGDAMGSRVCINGTWYVREDTVAPERIMPAAEPWVPLRRLCGEYGIDPHKAYDAQRDGALDARMPNGCVRGMRVRRSEFERWMNEMLMPRSCAAGGGAS